MATATTLSQAAGQAYDNLHIIWLADDLPGRIALFCQNSLPIFPATLEGGLPVAHWLTVFSSLGVTLPATAVPIVQLTAAAQILYRLCWLAFSLIGNGITTSQATQLLANYNTFLGF